MFILYPDPYLQPRYRIKPFRTADIAVNHKLPDDDFIDEFFSVRFSGRRFKYTYNGREAINMALRHYKLSPDDVVTIFTTTGNFYISHVVTEEIEKFCKWSRQIENKTKVIFVNHEFGYPYINLKDVRKYGLPVIEDRAYSFFSHDKEDNIGTIGDFEIYSLPKMFPLQIGGIIATNLDIDLPPHEQLNQASERHIKNSLSYYIRQSDEICRKRLENYSILAELFKTLGFDERFERSERVVPAVFMFKNGERHIDLNELKKHFYLHGIHCSVFYGEETFFIPSHQALNQYDLEYFQEVMKAFLNESGA